MSLIRQGDVLLVPVESIPDDVKDISRENGQVILAYGEVTGHSHFIVEEEVRLVTSEQAQQLKMWLLVETVEPVELRHDEHDTLLIPPGQYIVRRQREYHPEGLRNVGD